MSSNVEGDVGSRRCLTTPRTVSWEVSADQLLRSPDPGPELRAIQQLLLQSPSRRLAVPTTCAAGGPPKMPGAASRHPVVPTSDTAQASDNEVLQSLLDLQQQQQMLQSPSRRPAVPSRLITDNFRHYGTFPGYALPAHVATAPSRGPAVPTSPAAGPDAHPSGAHSSARSSRSRSRSRNGFPIRFYELYCHEMRYKEIIEEDHEHWLPRATQKAFVCRMGNTHKVMRYTCWDCRKQLDAVTFASSGSPPYVCCPVCGISFVEIAGAYIDQL